MTDTVSAPAPIAVIGIGNVLLGDDGFGPFVVELLHSRWDFPENVTLLDVGTPGLDLVTYLQGRDLVILVDAVAAPGRPGELRIYRREDLEMMAPQPRVSPHDPAVPEALGIAELAGRGPREVLLVGVIPESIELGAGLSETVRAAAAAATALVVRELANCGAAPFARPEPIEPNTWWIREPALADEDDEGDCDSPCHSNSSNLAGPTLGSSGIVLDWRK